MKIFFVILAVLLLFGMVGDDIQQNRNNFTWAFIVTIICIVVLHIVG